MVVIARFPRLDQTAVAACPAVPDGATAAMALAVPVGVDPVAAGAPTTPALPERSRAPRLRFPALSTLVLALIAGLFWAAVWREERRHAGEDADHDSHVALEPDTGAGLIR